MGNCYKILLVLFFITGGLSYCAVEEFIDVSFGADNNINFSRSAIGVPFLTVQLYQDNKSISVFNHLPFKLSLIEGQYLIRVEVTDCDRKFHTNYYLINKSETNFSRRVQITKQGKLITIPEGKKGLNFLYKTAKDAESEKDFTTAAEIYHKLLALGVEPEIFREVLLSLIEIYTENKEYKQLFYFCKQFLRYFPKDEKTPDTIYLTANILFSYGKYKEAAWLYERGNELSARPEINFEIGYCYEQIKDYEKAIDHYEKFLTDTKEDANKTAVCVFRLAGLNYLLGDYFAGRVKIEEEITTEEIGFTFEEEEKEDIKKGENNLAISIEKDGKKDEYIQYTAEEKEHLKQKYYTQTYYLYQSFIIKYPQHYFYNEALFRFSGLCYDLCRYNESLGYLTLLDKKQISEEMKRKSIYRQGLCYLGRKDYRKSISIFSDIQKTYRGTEEAKNSTFYIGLGYYHLCDYLSGYGYFTGFLGMAENSPLVPEATYYSIACLFYEYLRKLSSNENIENLKEEMEPLLEQLKQLVFMYPDSIIAPEAEELIAKGYEILTGEEELFEKEGLYVDLNSYMQAVMEKYPNGPDKLFYNEGMKLIGEKKYEEAGGYFLAILQKFPGSGFLTDARYQLGLVYGNLTAYRQGIETLKMMVNEAPKHQYADDSLYLIGYYCLCLESYKNAKKAFEILLANYPDSPRAQWAKKDLQLIEEKGLLTEKKKDE